MATPPNHHHTMARGRLMAKSENEDERDGVSESGANEKMTGWCGQPVISDALRAAHHIAYASATWRST